MPDDKITQLNKQFSLKIFLMLRYKRSEDELMNYKFLLACI